MKRGIGVLMISLLLVLPLATAGIFDWFKRGEVQEGPYDVSVNVGNTPPTVEKFIAVFEDDAESGIADWIDDDGGVITVAGEIQGDPGGNMGDGGTMDIGFKFTVEDLDGPGDLPWSGGFGAIQLGTNVIVTFTEPANDVQTAGTNTVTASICEGVSCVGNSDCNDQTAGTNELLYRCRVPIDYNDPPTIGTADPANMWTIDVQVYDSTGTNNAQANSVDFGTLSVDYIDYWTISSVATPPGTTIIWGNLDINAGDQPSNDGNDLTMQNAGNRDITNEDVHAYNLVQDGVPANTLLASAFGVSNIDGGNYVPGPIVPDTGACDVGGAGVALIHDTDVTVGIAIPYTGAGIGGDTATMYHCIWPTVNPTYLGGSPSSSYVANAANSNQWLVDFNS
ncbi:MAG: hypothetical protein ABIB79_04120 [archaeon]